MEFFGSNEERMGWRAYIEVGDPIARGGGTPAAEPPRRADRGPVCNFFYKKMHVALLIGDRGLFFKFLGTAIYF